METTTIDLATPDGPMALYTAAPEGAPRGAVIVVQEAFGVNDHIRAVTRRCADAGFSAVAPALFHRAGGGTASYDDFASVLPLYEGLDDAAIIVDLDATLEHLRAAGWADAQIGTVGFCFGGRVTFLAAARYALGAAVGFYGGGIVSTRRPQFPALVGEAAALRTPWLGLFGDEDPSIPIDDVETLRAALAAAPVDCEIVRYPGAQHGFHCDARDSYDPTAAADAWARTLAWLARLEVGGS
jgi:carboxymethylenebutenolidase